VVPAPTSSELRQAAWLYNVQKSCSEKLLQSMATGELQDVLTKNGGRPAVMQRSFSSPSVGWRFKPSVGTWVNRLPPSRSNAVDPAAAMALCAEAVRSHVCKVLDSAVSGGSWQKTFGKACKSEDPVDIGVLRAVALEILMQRSQNGTLQETISRLLEAHGIHIPHFNAHEVLLKALGGGSLDEALSQMHRRSADDLDTLRSQTCGALMNAADDGTLHRIFSELCHDGDANDVQSPRSQARELFLTSLANGSLEQNVTETAQNRPETSSIQDAAAEVLPVRPDEEELEAMRSKVLDSMLHAMGDGSLARVLAEASQRKQDRSDGDLTDVEHLRSTVPDGMMGALTDVEQVRSTVLDSMMGALKNGSLHQVLSDASEQNQEGSVTNANDLQDIRSKLLDAMVEAADDGNLLKILSEVAQRKEAETEETVEKLRSWAQDVLLTAHADGTLQQALSSVCDGQAALSEAGPVQASAQGK